MAHLISSKSWLDNNKVDLNAKINQSVLPHALLLKGYALAGQDELAVWLANKLLCTDKSEFDACGRCKSCLLLASKSHPDIQIIDNGDKTIGVDLVRQASQFFQKTAQLGQNKVVIIKSSEYMTEAAANALLKTLEEPTQNSFLLLTCNDADLLLPTIISRCSQIQIQPPVGQELADLVDDKSILHDFSNINQFAELTDDFTKQAYLEFNQQLILWLQNFADYSQLMTLFNNNNQSLRWLVDCFHQLIRMQSGWADALSSHPAKLLQDKYTTEQLWQCLHLAMQANKQIKLLTQANKNFTIEALLVDIEQQLQK
ncbi:DNA polymerase III subunit delta' [Thalassomonas sp. M1454]|uniref:DNA polymerase III subunit delta' n=1 Tax=Thalassomonas sp. M1454 TaxID=2594477 RepID=UPI001180000A|nr:DNA polymerase III subunit delta' [Thalassomonas sp. M1454]TRX56651.1 hypothetical protein FNN08_03745 [Thalassomonas sp. M1454]